MAAAHKGRTPAKPGPGKPASAATADNSATGDPEVGNPGVGNSGAGNPGVSEPAMAEFPALVIPAIAPPGIAPTRSHASDGAAASMNGIRARSMGPGAGLIDAQIRTLAELCEALDQKCLDLLEDVATARSACTVAEQALARIGETHRRELAEAHRTQAMLERELAAIRSELERANSLRTIRDDRLDPQRSNREAHAVRLLRLLEAGLAAGTVLPMQSASQALARFGAAGTLDAVEGTRAAPSCRGWLLSRADLAAEPLMFLMDQAGLLGWTDANNERLDVNNAFPNTKPRPGFMAPLYRVPVGPLRGIVAMDQAAGGDPVFFETPSLAAAAGKFVDPEN